MFGTLLYFGREIYQAAPPIPTAVRTEAGDTVFTGEQILRGQNVWQSLGGMQQGSVWGHGSYVAPDWSADWLHREAQALLDGSRARTRRRYAQQSAPDQARLREMLRQAMRTNTYDPQSGVLAITDDRARAIALVGAHYSDLFRASPDAQNLREQYAFPVTRHSLPRNRPPERVLLLDSLGRDHGAAGRVDHLHEQLAARAACRQHADGAVFMWTFISIFVLLGGIGTLVWYYAREFDIWRRDGEPEKGFARQDFMNTATVTPSMRATSAYFVVVTLLFVAQVLLGIVTAHYAVEGQGLYGLPLSRSLPVLRDPHLAYAACRALDRDRVARDGPLRRAAAGRPRAEVPGGRSVVPLVSLVVIVAGSFAGEWLAINRMIADATRNFWFGHQGYEYVDLGRFWQIYLFVGLLSGSRSCSAECGRRCGSRRKAAR